MKYLHLGQEIIVRTQEILGIFDLDHVTPSRRTQQFLRLAEQQGNVVTAGTDLPKSMILCGENGKTTVYLSQISAGTLQRRAAQRDSRRPGLWKGDQA